MTDTEVVKADSATNKGCDYRIKIMDCNSITEVVISLRRFSLNIKYGPNGIGKSTIARALTSHADGDGSLDALTPFKYKSDGQGPSPRSVGL